MDFLICSEWWSEDEKTAKSFSERGGGAEEG